MASTLNHVELADCRLQVLDQGTGSVLLLVHGFPLDHSMWREQVASLSGSYRVIAPDLRGFGGSTGAGDTLPMSQLADDLASLLDRLGITEPIALCGLSMGGYVAFEFWRRHKARLNRLILCDTRAVADSDEAAQGREELAKKVLADGPQIAADAMLPKLLSAETVAGRPHLVEEMRQVMLSIAPSTIAAALRGLARRDDFSSQLSQIDVPTLVICGEHDAISPATEMQGIAAAMSNAQFVEIAGAGHMSPLEAPAEVNAAIRAFMTM